MVQTSKEDSAWAAAALQAMLKRVRKMAVTEWARQATEALKRADELRQR